MLIWIDGPAGCGKTTTLCMLKSMIDNDKCRFLDSDVCYKQYLNNIDDNSASISVSEYIYHVKNTSLSDCLFHIYFRELIDAEIRASTVIVTMSLINMYIKENLYDYYRNNPSVSFKHLMLTASHEQLESRILNDNNREYKKDHLADLALNLKFLNDHYHNREDIWIDTTDKSSDEVAKEIVRIIGLD